MKLIRIEFKYVYGLLSVMATTKKSPHNPLAHVYAKETSLKWGNKTNHFGFSPSTLGVVNAKKI